MFVDIVVADKDLVVVDNNSVVDILIDIIVVDKVVVLVVDSFVVDKAVDTVVVDKDFDSFDYLSPLLFLYINKYFFN